jgi:Asp-tRNA(Asn)/Glu-tRNA(Gln) amidotransferase C subunit
MMDLTKEQVRELAKAVSLEIPEADLNNVTLRLSSLLTAMESIERELGPEMDKTEPVPPVYPHEEF